MSAETPSKPSRALSGYNFFLRDRRAELAKEQQDLSTNDAIKQIGHEWKQHKAANSERYQEYERMAKKDKERYARELEASNKKAANQLGGGGSAAASAAAAASGSPARRQAAGGTQVHRKPRRTTRRSHLPRQAHEGLKPAEVALIDRYISPAELRGDGPGSSPNWLILDPLVITDLGAMVAGSRAPAAAGGTGTHKVVRLGRELFARHAWPVDAEVLSTAEELGSRVATSLCKTWGGRPEDAVGDTLGTEAIAACRHVFQFLQRRKCHDQSSVKTVAVLTAVIYVLQQDTAWMHTQDGGFMPCTVLDKLFRKTVRAIRRVVKGKKGLKRVPWPALRELTTRLADSAHQVLGEDGFKRLPDVVLPAAANGGLWDPSVVGVTEADSDDEA